MTAALQAISPNSMTTAASVSGSVALIQTAKALTDILRKRVHQAAPFLFLPDTLRELPPQTNNRVREPSVPPPLVGKARGGKLQPHTIDPDGRRDLVGGQSCRRRFPPRVRKKPFTRRPLDVEARQERLECGAHAAIRRVLPRASAARARSSWSSS